MAFQPVSDPAMAKLWFQLHLRGGTRDFWSVSSDSKYFIQWLCVTLCNVLDVYLVTMQPLLDSHQCEIRIKPHRRFMKAIQRPVFHLLLLLLQFAVIPCAMQKTVKGSLSDFTIEAKGTTGEHKCDYKGK